MHYKCFSTIPVAEVNTAMSFAFSTAGTVQILAHIDMNPDENTLKMETKTKSWMHGLINYMVKILGREILLIGLEFEDPMKRLKGK